MLHLKLQKVKSFSPSAKKNRAKPKKQKGKKEGGWGEGIFALLRLRIERFRFPLNQRKPKQKIFHLLLKERNGGRKKLKKCNEKISVLVRRSGAEASGNAPIELPRSPSVRLGSEPSRTRSVRQSGFCSKKVRISTKRYRTEKIPSTHFLRSVNLDEGSVLEQSGSIPGEGLVF